jgi:hypothetical protein
MSDPVELRITLVDDNTGGGGGGGTGGGGGGRGGGTFDPDAEAQRRLDRLDREAEVKAAMDKLRPPPPAPPESPFVGPDIPDTLLEARRREMRQRREAQIQNELDDIYGREVPEVERANPVPKLETAFDPQWEARQRAQKLREKAAVENALDDELGRDAPEAEAAGGGGGGLDQLAQSVMSGKLPNPQQLMAMVGGELGAAAGTAGLMYMAAQQVEKKIDESFERARSVATATGQLGASIASNDMRAVAGEVAQGMSSLAKEVPVVGHVLGQMADTGIAFVDSWNKVIDAFLTRGRELAPYSQSLTEATTTADLRSMMADMREADQLGPSLSRLTDAQSRLVNEFRELVLPIKEVVVNGLAFYLERIVQQLERANEVSIDARASADMMAELRDAAMRGDVNKTNELLRTLPQRLREQWENDQRNRDDLGAEKLMNQLLGIRDKLPNVPAQPWGAPPGDLNLPAFAQR